LIIVNIINLLYENLKHASVQVLIRLISYHWPAHVSETYWKVSNYINNDCYSSFNVWFHYFVCLCAGNISKFHKY